MVGEGVQHKHHEPNPRFTLPVASTGVPGRLALSPDASPTSPTCNRRTAPSPPVPRAAWTITLEDKSSVLLPARNIPAAL